MPDLFESLLDRLIAAGIAPRIASRYRAELLDHWHDLRDEARIAGLDPEAASAEASRRIGSLDQLLLPMLVDRRAFSWARRRPVIAFVVLPPLVVLAALPALVMAVVAIARLAVPPALLDYAIAAAGLLWLGLPLFTAWTCTLLAGNRRAPLKWPLLGAAACALLGSALSLSIEAPGAASTGSVAVTLAQPDPLVLAVVATLALLPALILRSWSRS